VRRAVDGWSESAWKSLAIKSLRIGWPEGLRQAERRLSPSILRSTLIVSLFEDVFPPESELLDAVDELNRHDWHALCAREAHHGRGYTGAFCDLADEAIAAAKNPGFMYSKARRRRLPYLPPRAWNVFWTWLRLEPDDLDARRPLDDTPWGGMPAAVIDAHTTEGRRRRTGYTSLSSDYETHRVIGVRVRANGWGPLRTEVHAELAERVLHGTLEPRAGRASLRRCLTRPGGLRRNADLLPQVVRVATGCSELFQTAASERRTNSCGASNDAHRQHVERPSTFDVRSFVACEDEDVAVEARPERSTVRVPRRPGFRELAPCGRELDIRCEARPMLARALHLDADIATVTGYGNLEIPRRVRELDQLAPRDRGDDGLGEQRPRPHIQAADATPRQLQVRRHRVRVRPVWELWLGSHCCIRSPLSDRRPCLGRDGDARATSRLPTRR
jgi:hypothetical protein